MELEWRVLSRLEGEAESEDWRIVTDINSMPRLKKTRGCRHSEIEQRQDNLERLNDGIRYLLRNDQNLVNYRLNTKNRVTFGKYDFISKSWPRITSEAVTAAVFSLLPKHTSRLIYSWHRPPAGLGWAPSLVNVSLPRPPSVLRCYHNGINTCPA